MVMLGVGGSWRVESLQCLVAGSGGGSSWRQEAQLAGGRELDTSQWCCRCVDSRAAGVH